MSTATIKLYNVLVDQGVDRAVAEQAIEPLLTKDEALSKLATKDDLHALTKWVAVLVIGQFVATVGALGGLMIYLV